jgi:hypothetical protein
MRRLLAALVLSAAIFAAAGVSPVGMPAIGTQSAYAKPCPAGFVHAVFTWSTRHRCLKAGQYCERAGNPQYHKYGFQCVNNRLRKQTGQP